MDKFRFLVQLPFLAHLLMPLAAMGLPVYQINRRGVGTQRVDAHRAKPSAWRSAFRAQVNALREFMSSLVPIAAILVMAIVLAQALPHAQDGVMMATAGVVSIKQLRQEKAETESAIAANAAKQSALKVEGRGIFAIAADKRTPEQVARLTAIDGEVDALVAAEAALATKAATIASELVRAERYADTERAQATTHVSLGANRESQAPWGPQVPANASAAERRRATEQGLGSFLQAVITAGMPGGAVDPRLLAAPTGASTSVPSDGGHLVQTDFSTFLLDNAMQSAQVASLCDTVTVGANSDSLEAPFVDETSRATGSRFGGVRVYRRAEAATVDPSKVKLGKWELRLEDLMAITYMTDRSMSDAPALAGIVNTAFSSEFAFVVDDEIIRGDGGNGQCYGVITAGATATAGKESGQLADTIVTGNLSRMWMHLHPRKRANAVWFYNSELEQQLDQLTLPAGTGALEPRFVNYGPDGILRIKGRPAIALEQCSAPGDLGDIILADWRDYVLITKGGLEQAESMHVRFVYGEKCLRWMYRINGQPKQKTTLTPYKGSKQLGSFVILEAR